MKGKKSVSTFICALLIFMLTFGQAAVFAVSYGDIDGHWASSEINKWSEKGLLQGSDGMFKPEDNITRAEMSVVIDRLMDYQETGKNVFKDLGNDWYTEAILKNSNAGVINGSNGLVRPMDSITRQEAVVMLSRAMGIVEVNGKTSFNDDDKIASWAKGYVNAFSKKGYIDGMPDGSFAPEKSITRAAVVRIVDNMIAEWINTAGTVTKDFDGNVIINTADVKLKGSTVKGDLIIAEGVGNGEVNLDNVTVTGDVKVRGGGENSVYFNNCTVEGGLVVQKKDGKVRIVASGKTEVKVAKLNSGAILVEQQLKGTGFESVVISPEVAKDSDILIKGSFANLDVSAEDVNVLVDKKSNIDNMDVSTNINLVADGKIKSVTLKSGVDELNLQGKGTVTSFDVESKNSTLNVEEDVSISDLSIQSKNVTVNCVGTINKVTAEKSSEGFTLKGTGTTGTVSVKADNVTIDTKGTEVSVSKGIEGTKAGGKDLKDGKTSTTSGKPSTGDTSVADKPSSGDSGHSSGGHSTPSRPTNTEKVATAKSNLKIAGDLSKVTDDLVLVTKQDGVSVTWTSNNEDVISIDGKVTRPIAGLDNAVVTLTAALTCGDASDTKTFEVTVIAEDAKPLGITYKGLNTTDGVSCTGGAVQVEVYNLKGSVVTTDKTITFTFNDGEDKELNYTTSEENETAETIAKGLANTEIADWTVTASGSAITFKKIKMEANITCEGNLAETDGLTAERNADSCVEGAEPTFGVPQVYTVTLEGTAEDTVVVTAVFNDSRSSKIILKDDKSAKYLAEQIAEEMTVEEFTIDNPTGSAITFTANKAKENVKCTFDLEYNFIPSQELADSIISENKGTTNTTATEIKAVPKGYIVYFSTDELENLDNAVCVNEEETTVDLSKFEEGDKIYAYIVNKDLNEIDFAVKSTNSLTIDNTAPELTLIGEDEIEIAVGSTYIDKGVTINDDTLTSDDVVVTITNSINDKLENIDTSRGEDFTITYSVTDSAGNKAEITRKVTVYDQLESINPFKTISVINGTEIDTINFPKNVELNLASGMIENTSIGKCSWICENYDANTNNDYTFTTSDFKLPSHIKDKDDVYKGSLSVTVSVINAYELKSIDSLDDISVKYGTEESDIPFPKEIQIVLNNDNTKNVDISEVKWSCDGEYDSSKPENYTFTAELPLPSDVANNNDISTIINLKVTVLEEVTGETYTVSFDTGDDNYIIDDIEVPAGETLDCPYMYKYGYDAYNHWYKDSSYKEEFYGSKVTSDLTLYWKWELQKGIDEEKAEEILSYKDDRFADGYPKLKFENQKPKLYIKLKDSSEAVVSMVFSEGNYYSVLSVDSILDGHVGITTVLNGKAQRIKINDTEEHCVEIGGYKYEYAFAGFVIEQNDRISEFPTIVDVTPTLSAELDSDEDAPYIDDLVINNDKTKIYCYLSNAYDLDMNSTANSDEFIIKNIEGVSVTGDVIVETVGNCQRIVLNVSGLSSVSDSDINNLVVEYKGTNIKDESGNIMMNYEYQNIRSSELGIDKIYFSEDKTHMMISFNNSLLNSNFEKLATYGNKEIEFNNSITRNNSSQFKRQKNWYIINNGKDLPKSGDLNIKITNMKLYDGSIIKIEETYKNEEINAPIPTLDNAVYDLSDKKLDIYASDYDDDYSECIIGNFQIMINDEVYRLYNGGETKIDDVDFSYLNDEIRFKINENDKVKLRLQPKLPSASYRYSLCDKAGKVIPSTDWIEVTIQD